MSEAMENAEQKLETHQQNEATIPSPSPSPSPSSPPLSKNAKKKLQRQQRYEAKKAEKKAAIKEQKKLATQMKKKEWEDKLASMPEDEKLKLVEERKGIRKERMGKRSEERDKKLERLKEAKQSGQNIVVDLEFSHLMTPSEMHSLVQQIMYCYADNGKRNTPGHLWLTGCEGEMGTYLNKLPGYDKWIIEKENRSYIETFKDRKGDLVYLTADSETVLDVLDPTKIYIVGGLVDRNRWKGITMKKAVEQGIQTAKLPIGNYLKMCSSQVLTVNQVMEILLNFVETRDWKASFFHAIPQRKIGEAEATFYDEEKIDEEEEDEEEDGEKIDQEEEEEDGEKIDQEEEEDGEKIDQEENEETVDDPDRKRQCLESASLEEDGEKIDQEEDKETVDDPARKRQCLESASLEEDGEKIDQEEDKETVDDPVRKRQCLESASLD
ncbi:tRNA (guanine(9)-N1)-methyltransferase [Impatiens glandulifera]|uniref:tRNA (guanine(9)-N1)-methyltransferase n=1 Tax=Impatiens glandulifera TaxID=253017 RepID=UPI001FB10FD1|nr:tRNA (guanine(9)-N1)-methyltransferase [Impatiens glandulifera]